MPCHTFRHYALKLEARERPTSKGSDCNSSIMIKLCLGCVRFIYNGTRPLERSSEDEIMREIYCRTKGWLDF